MSAARAALGIEVPGLVDCADTGFRLQASAWEAFQRLALQASAAGFALRLESAQRPFARQLSIWNRKARGELALLDPQGKPLDALALSPAERMRAILFWSALPGTSRHHWGSDLDLSDSLAIPPGYEVQLSPSEVAPEGPFGPLHAWLDERIARDDAEGFFRPYVQGAGGVQPERWHLSHRPSAEPWERAFRPEALRDELLQADLALRDEVLAHLDQILERYCLCYFGGPKS
jgi:LAS superfamily LD-carboxypeptidase LdcB